MIPIFGYEILHTRALILVVRMNFESMSEDVKTLYFTDKRIKKIPLLKMVGAMFTSYEDGLALKKTTSVSFHIFRISSACLRTFYRIVKSMIVQAY